MGQVVSMAHVVRSCGCNQVNALVNRHAKVQLPCAPLIMFASLAAVLRSRVQLYYRHHFPTAGIGWLAKWPAAKQAAIKRSQEDDIPYSGRVKAMIKREVDHDVPTRGRLIQAYANLHSQAIMAPEFYTLQKACAELFNDLAVYGFRITFASGLNAKELGAWMKNAIRQPVWFYERDGKNWDAMMSAEHHRAITLFYGVSPALWRWVEDSHKIKGRAYSQQGVLKYQLTGTTKSGFNDTTLRNSLINIAVCYEAAVHLGLTADILVAGDDLLAAFHQDFNLQELMAAERRYGIHPVAGKFRDWRDVSFISGIWVPGVDGPVFSPKPGRLFSRLFWTVNPPIPRQRDAYLRGVVRGLLPVARYNPLLLPFLQAHDPAEPGPVLDKTGKTVFLTDTPCAPGDMADWVLGRYGLNGEEVAAVARLWTGKPGLVVNPLIDRILAVDMASVDTRVPYGSAAVIAV